MNKKALYALLLCFCTLPGKGQNGPTGGADEKTPSKSEYFSWINNTNEGATAAQTEKNLAFFKWLHDRYGMQLDLYAFDAGAIDGSRMYGNMESERFKRQFPNGFAPLSKQAAAMNTRLGIWGGPDGFGDTEAQARERMDMMVSLVDKYNFGLFKMDAVCGQLRPEKYGYFDEMMTRVRQLSPDFVLLNHRLELGPGVKHSTTFLLGGAETYIDVHMTNHVTAPHHRAGAISRKAPDNLTRLTEDHGVCISSCLDYWEDDLVLQAFGRDLILAPEIYGNPWLLRDDEYSYLAFLFNLHRTYNEILVNANRLPEQQYGPEAITRGDGKTQFLTLRNLTWNPVTYKVTLNKETGLQQTGKQVKVRLYHPYIYDMGSHRYGETIEVTVEPFRAALVKMTVQPERDKVAFSGIPYQIINDKTGNPTEVMLLGMPGETYNVKLEKCQGKFRSVLLDGKSEEALKKGKTIQVTFPGKRLQESYHRKLVDLQACDVPQDASSIYYATAFAGDNNALEARSLARSGETHIPEVKAARDAFFEQPLFKARELWDGYLFDGDKESAFSISFRHGDTRFNGESSFCLDLGEPTAMDKLVLESFDEYSITPLKTAEGAFAQFSTDLVNWKTVTFLGGKRMEIDTRGVGAFRYFRFNPCPFRLTEVSGIKDGRELDRTKWHASNLFRTYGNAGCNAVAAWKNKFRLDEAAEGSYLCIAINGRHGREAAWAALKMDGHYVGCPDRAPSFTINPWEFRSDNSDSNYTYYIPVTSDMIGKDIEAWTLSFEGKELKPEVWLTAYPIPFKKKPLRLE